MQGVNRFIRDANWFAMVVAVVGGVFLVTMVANASSTISTGISTGGTLDVTGATTLSSTLAVTSLSTLTGGFVSQASSTVSGGAFTSAGALYASSTMNVTGLATLSGNASTTALIVGGDSTHGTVAGIVFGTCAVNPGSISASSTVVTTCTATGVRLLDKVFVTPQNEPNQIIFVGASSTAADTIQIALYNTGATRGAFDPGSQTWSWMAIR